ncbi:hypothetical protein CVV68_22655 [Arthrobacter livingstonensis]|uniref:Uncharacterized protein n=1 Tax=Arthrobacter livingstonensis TaxID=670078 RepID=A0A2V5L2Z9_9MICC|nr:hypothetical protein CVV68_22655 [Arthrobacter livingstonensis]
MAPAPFSCLGYQRLRPFCRIFAGPVLPSDLRALDVFPEALATAALGGAGFPGLGGTQSRLHSLLIGHAVETGSQHFSSLGQVIFEASLITQCFASVIFFGRVLLAALVSRAASTNIWVACVVSTRPAERSPCGE